MLQTISSLPFRPLGFLAYLGLAIVLAGASGLPLWLSRRGDHARKYQFIADPFLLTWIAAIGLLALFYWPLVIVSIISTAVIVMRIERFGDSKPSTESLGQWIEAINNYYQRNEQAGEEHLKALRQARKPLLLQDLVARDRWDEVIEERYDYLRESTEALWSDDQSVFDERARQRMMAALVVWVDLTLAWHLEQLGITPDLDKWRVVELHQPGEFSPAVNDAGEIAAILAKRPYADDPDFTEWVVDRTIEWTASGSANQAKLLQVWQTEKRWLPSGIFLMVGEHLTGDTHPRKKV